MAVVNTWPTLPTATRRQVMAMIEAAVGVVSPRADKPSDAEIRSPAANWPTIALPKPATGRERLATMLTGNQGDERGREAEREAQP